MSKECTYKFLLKNSSKHLKYFHFSEKSKTRILQNFEIFIFKLFSVWNNHVNKEIKYKLHEFTKIISTSFC